LPRFGYEPSTQQCHQFIYRGLKGNQNNFLTLEECQLACLPNPCPSGRKFLGIETQCIFSSIGIFISGILPTKKNKIPAFRNSGSRHKKASGIPDFREFSGIGTAGSLVDTDIEKHKEPLALPKTLSHNPRCRF